MTLNDNVTSSKENNTLDSKKCFLIYNDSKSNTAWRMSNLSQEIFQGIPCIKGTSVLDDHWSNGKTFYIPVKHISQIVEFDSIESLRQARKGTRKVTLKSIFRSNR